MLKLKRNLLVFILPICLVGYIAVSVANSDNELSAVQKATNADELFVIVQNIKPDVLCDQAVLREIFRKEFIDGRTLCFLRSHECLNEHMDNFIEHRLVDEGYNCP